MANLITGQRDPPEPPATRVNPFADYVSQNPRVAHQQADHSADQENCHDTPVPDLHLPDEDLHLSTEAAPASALSSELTVAPPFMTQPSAVPNMNLFGPAAAGNYVAPSASRESVWLNCEVPHPESQRAFLSTSKMPSGKLSMIVDSGAFSNMIGEELAMTLEQRAQDVELAPARSDLLRPMTVSGVGNGTNQAIEQVTCPIAVQTTDGKVELHTLRAPVISGSGKHLPGLLGLQTLEANNAVLDIGNRTLHMLCKGKAQLELPPGTLSVPLEKSPSGHLVMTIDSFEDIQRQRGGLPQRSINWHAAKASPDQPPPVVTALPKTSIKAPSIKVAPQQPIKAPTEPAQQTKQCTPNSSQMQTRCPVEMPPSALKKTPSH